MRDRTIGLLVAVAAAAGTVAGCRWINEPPRMADLATRTSDYQWAALGDGVLTEQEYLAANSATTDCLAGIDAPGLRVQQDEPGSWSVSWSGGAADPGDRVDRLMERCHRTYSADISGAWVYKHLLPERRREELRRDVIRCLRDGGAEIAADATHEEVYRVAVPRRPARPAAAVAACRERHLSYFVVAVR
jgi:hypothetical protein